MYFDFSLNLGVGHNNEGEFHPEDQIEQQILEDEESEILDCENPAPYPPEHGLAIHSICLFAMLIWISPFSLMIGCTSCIP